MKSGFKLMTHATADQGEPLLPTPFPIRIISDPLPSEDIASPVLQIPEERDDSFYPAWDRFLRSQPRRTISTAARRIKEEKHVIEEGPVAGLTVNENAATSLEQATEECKAKVKAIVDECRRLNQKYRDAVFDLEVNPYCLQSLHGVFPTIVDLVDSPPWIKRVEDIFDDPQFFVDGASATDVHQGGGGDCWFLAALMAVSAKKELIENLCVARDPQVGVYGFVFYRDGEWISEVIDDKLFLKVGDDDDVQLVRDWDKDKKQGRPLKTDGDKLKSGMQRGGEALYFSHCKSSETWLPLIEKAYAKAHGDYLAIEGGFPAEAIEDLTGGVGVVLNPEDIMDKERFWKEQLSMVNTKYLFGGSSKPSGGRGFVGGHAYAVLQTWEEDDLRLLKLRNPWGEVEWDGDWSDGSKLWTADMMIKLAHTFGDDGVFWMTFSDFLKHFPSINRVRLFTKDWQVAQQWTCVNVPWTVDYLDTKFQFTIANKGPVVVVLSQPDERYFFGFCGRYLYSLHFRIYQEGREGRWLVRSMHSSGAETTFTRSVSAELENLEAGTYSVVFKVTPTRLHNSPTQEEQIRKYAKGRKEKLLQVGRRFEYAQTKGNLRAMEEAVAKQKNLDEKEMRKRYFKKQRCANQQEKARMRLRKQRVDDAMREARREFELKQREKSKQRRQRMVNRRAKQFLDVQAGASGGNVRDSKDGDAMPTTQEEAAPAESKHEPEKANVKDDEEEGVHGKGEPDDSDKRTRKISDDHNAITTGLSNLQLGDRRPSSRTDSQTTDPEDEEYDSPLDEPEQLDDNDFDWDSDLDDPVDFPTSDSDDAEQSRCKGSSSKKDIFSDDPWNALCVLGLRVYSLNSAATVTVIKGENNS